MTGVLVYNADAVQVLHRVDLKHAIRLLHRRKAVIHEADPTRHPIGAWPWPKAVALVNYVYARWLYGRSPGWSKRGVLTRDNHTCGYCGNLASTVDHIDPVSHGGRNTWLNTVAACDRCNQRKADLTLKQAFAKYGMRLQIEPYAPGTAAWALAAAR